MKIEGFFENSKVANETIAELKESGFQKAYVDLNDNYNIEASKELSGLSEPANNQIIGYKKSPLKPTNSQISCMGFFDEAVNCNCRVVVDIDIDNNEKVKEIITKNGGIFENPNGRKPTLN